MAATKRKHKLKKQEPLPHIEGDFLICGCDLSMYGPAFALMKYNAADRRVILIRKDVCSNGHNAGKKKPHGKILGEISSMFGEFIKGNDLKVVVRERAISRFNQEVITLNKVCGVTEMFLWYVLQQPFQEITPSEVKKYVTGYGRAEKSEVAIAIDNYCSHAAFKDDNESDACGVAIAWLVQNGYLDCVPLEKYKDRIKDNDVDDE